MPDVVRRTLAQLTRRAMVAAALAGFALPNAAAGATAPRAIQGPRAAVHTEFLVETNHLGQVTRVRSGTSSNDASFNAMTYGNALQAFIRTADGRAIPGTYKLVYDYNPRNKKVRRSVSLVHAGGVDPSAPGAVTVEAQKLAAAARKHAKPGASPAPLPDLESITGNGH